LKRLDTPAALSTARAATTEGGDGQSDASDRHQEASSAAELAIESVVSIHESPPESKEGKRGGGMSEREKNTTDVINLADLETNSEVH
jgi:hypothetical protein